VQRLGNLGNKEVIFGFAMPDARCRIPDARCQIQDARYHDQKALCRVPITSYRAGVENFLPLKMFGASKVMGFASGIRHLVSSK